MPVNLNGMDPRVLAALKKIQADAAARGIQTNVINAFRTLDDQKQLYANYIAGKQGQPLPFPDRGAVPLAAVPGTSLHEKGLAFDLQATDPSRQNELWSLAPSEGLRTIGSSDPNHFELASDSQPSRPATGMATTKSGLLEALQHFESGGRNIPNTHQGDAPAATRAAMVALRSRSPPENAALDRRGPEGDTRRLGPLRHGHATKEQQDEIASGAQLAKRWARPRRLDIDLNDPGTRKLDRER